VLELHQRLKQEFEEGLALQKEAREDPERRGKTLGAP
jgi:hypothetical protein